MGLTSKTKNTGNGQLKGKRQQKKKNLQQQQHSTTYIQGESERCRVARLPPPFICLNDLSLFPLPFCPPVGAGRRSCRTAFSTRFLFCFPVQRRSPRALPNHCTTHNKVRSREGDSAHAYIHTHAHKKKIKTTEKNQKRLYLSVSFSLSVCVCVCVCVVDRINGDPTRRGKRGGRAWKSSAAARKQRSDFLYLRKRKRDTFFD